MKNVDFLPLKSVLSPINVFSRRFQGLKTYNVWFSSPDPILVLPRGLQNDPKSHILAILSHFGALCRPRILCPMIKMIHYIFYIHEISYWKHLWGLKLTLTEENRFFSFFSHFPIYFLSKSIQFRISVCDNFRFPKNSEKNHGMLFRWVEPGSEGARWYLKMLVFWNALGIN